MSIVKSTYSPETIYAPRFIRAEKDNSTSIIIIDDVTTGGLVDVHTEIDRPETWLKLTQGYGATVLKDAPSGISSFTPDHDYWSKIRILVQESEVYVILYSSTAKTSQSQITGYSLGQSDVLYIKIDQNSDKVTAYQ